MWNIVSYNSFDLTTDYQAGLPDEDNLDVLPIITAEYLQGSDQAPRLLRLKRSVDVINATIKIKAANKRLAYRTLVAAIRNDENSTHSLVVKDYNGDLWNVQARPVKLQRTAYTDTYKIVFEVPDKTWRKTATTITWNISSSPATQVVTNSGNRDTYPVIKVKPTSARGGGFLYRQWVPIIGVASILDEYSFNLANTVVNTTGWVADASVSNQINQGGGINNSVTTIPIDTAVGGGLPSRGMGYMDTEQISWTVNSGTSLTGVTRGLGGTTAASHADNAVIKKSYVKADFSDLALFKDGAEQDMWVRSPNSANTKLWTVLRNMGAAISLTVEAIATGALTTITFRSTSPNASALANLPVSGILLVDDTVNQEAFTYNGKNTLKYQVTVTKRADKDTSEHSFAAGTTAKWIPFDYWLYSGDPSRTAHVNDDTRAPMFDLDASTNGSWVYYQFWDKAGLRANRFKPSVVATSYANSDFNLQGTIYYPGNHGDLAADPATDAGLAMRSTYRNAKWNAENGDVRMYLTNPCGINNVDWDAEIYIVGTSWPTTASLRKSKDGSTWTAQITSAKPTVTSTWQAYTPAVQSLGSGYTSIEIRLTGSIMAGNTSGVGYQAILESDAIAFDVVTPPTVSIKTRNAAQYELNMNLANDLSGDEFDVKFTLPTNTEVKIDCANKIFTYLVDGQSYRNALFKAEDQFDWMKFEPGNNTLTYTEANVAGVQVTIDYDHMLVA